ncbi:MAG: tetratricopeptide repeat protein, partial [Pyrinomonadaceae bacterium]|nr:tetratricopeptide repeat protein [Pyrinomonadaceae bacterium]
MPFENTSDLPAYNWVGESFAESLTDLFARLDSRGTGLRVIPNGQRKVVQQKLRLPLTALPSLATSIKLANQSGAKLLVLGKYSVTAEQGDVAANLRVTVRVIKVSDGTFLGETLKDGRTIIRTIDLADALTKLQTLQGQVAHQVLYQREGNALSLSQNEVIELSRRVPPRAFEAYVKGMLTPATSETRANLFKNALRLYGEEKNGEIYPQASLELGHYYLKLNDYQTAADYFGRLQPSDSDFAEAAFYGGLMQWNLKNYDGAADTFRRLSDSTRLTQAYNNLGAVALYLATQDKKNENKVELLDEGLKVLQQASISAPDDVTTKFNYAYALFAAKRFKESAEQLKQVLLADQRDGQAYYLLSKANSRNGETEPATLNDNNARRYLPNYARVETEWQKSSTTNDIPFRLYTTFNRTEAVRNAEPLPSPQDDVQISLEKARGFSKAGRDDEALTELRKILVKDSMNAETYLLIGNVSLRRGDFEVAVSNYKTAIFWKNDLIEGHIA